MSVPRTDRFAPGQAFSKVVVADLRRTQIVQYAGASGDYNPLHSDDVYAREVGGFPGVFVHGMLTMGLTGTLLTDVVGIERITSFGGRFKAQVWPGDTLSASMHVAGSVDLGAGKTRVEFRLSTRNQDGLEVFAGEAVAVIGRSAG